MEEKLYAIYGPWGAVPQTVEMITSKAIFYNRPVGQYSDGQVVYKVWFLEPPSSQVEANEIARHIASQGANPSTTGGVIVVALAALVGVAQYFLSRSPKK